MSPIGRIFIVLNLILSAAFLGWASNALATTENYKQQLAEAQEAHAAALAEKDSENEQLNVRVNELSEGQRQFREQRDQLQATADSLKAQLAEEKGRNDQMATQIASIQATLSDYNDTISQLSTEKDNAIERAHEAEKARDDAVGKAQEAELAQRNAEEAQKTAETQISDLQAERSSLKDQLSAKETQLATLVEVTGVDVKDIMAQPAIDAAVLSVRLDLEPGLVMLNAGKDKAVKRGYTFEIYRGGQYKGRVRVENVQDSISSAVIVYQVPGKTIAQGDRAATQI